MEILLFSAADAKMCAISAMNRLALQVYILEIIYEFDRIVFETKVQDDDQNIPLC